MKLRTWVGCGALALMAACGRSAEETGDAGVAVTIPDSYRLGGTATGVVGELELTEASAGRVRISHDGPFWFDTLVPIGTQYAVVVSALPPDRFCSISSATGIMPRADVASLLVACQPLAVPAR
jgi:hypothetical protein